MGNTVDEIMGLIVRIDMNTVKTKKCTKYKIKKLGNKLINELTKKMTSIFTEENDKSFIDMSVKLINSPMINPYISSNFFPENIHEYGYYENIVRFTNDFKLEIRWMILCIKCYKEEINSFVALREKYDNYILLNNYDEALEVVSAVEYKMGISFWSLECKFFLYQKLGKNIEELVANTPKKIYGPILNFYELKNRENVTNDEYFYIVNKEIANLKKNIIGYDDIIEFFNYKISSIRYHEDLNNMLLLLSVIRSGSLIDRYLFIIDVCNYLINQPKENNLYVSMQKYIQLLEDVKDNHLSALRFIMDTDERRHNNYTLKNGLDKAKEEFVKGDLIKAREHAIDLLKLFPNNTEAMTLYVETNILIDDGNSDFNDTNLGMLLNRLSSIYRLTSDRDDCMEDVNKLATSCGQSTWSKSIINNLLSRWQEYGTFDYKESLILSNIQHLDIETLVTSLSKQECIQFIDSELDLQDNYVLFRKLMLEEEYEKASQICNVEQIKDLIYLYDCKNSIENKLKHLRHIDGVDASIAIRGMKYFLSVIDLNKNIDIVMQIATNLVIDNVYTSLFMPLEKIVAYIDDGPNEIRQNICTPILYYIYAYYFRKDKIDDLGIICGDFFSFANIESPSKMSIYSEKYGAKMMIYFLRYICSPKIMDVSICDFRNTQERDIERVEILKVLSQIDASNSKDYENEIREITQKLMINAELKIIEENRIHVNVDGMRDILEEKYKSDFMRYMFYKDERYQQFELLLEGDSNEKFRQIRDVPNRILNELIFRIRDAFVSSDEYGLNGYLSLNIRHGTLEDELRSPLYKSMITAKKDVKTNQYIVNERWMNFVNKSDAEVIKAAITNFYLKTEGIIAKLKVKYIQIRTAEKQTEGVFDYTLYERDIFNISVSMERVTTFEEFLDIIISYLWDITERNLLNIKVLIKSEIEQGYNQAFEQLKLEIGGLENKNRLRELLQKISEAEIDMANVLDRICYWFQRSTESKHSDFDIQFAFNLGLQTIKNMHPEKEFVAIEMEKTISDKIPGFYLKSFDGIFYNILDNIYKKADSPNGRIEIRYILCYEKGNVRIYIENDFNCLRDISDDKARVEEAKKLFSSGEYIKKVKGEGGTGLPKICKIITYDLKLYTFIDFGYKESENKFYIDIKF